MAQNKIEAFAEMEARKFAARDWYEHLGRRSETELVAYTREVNRGAILRWNQIQPVPVTGVQERNAWGRVYARNFYAIYREAYDQCQAENQFQAPAERVIFRCTVKTCKHAWASVYYRNDGGCLFRVEGVQRIYLNAEYPACPRCQYHEVKHAVVVGTVSERKCDARCRNAVGPDCSCQCGGVHHGEGLLAS